MWVICLAFSKEEPVRSTFFPNRAPPYIFMADSRLCLLRWPEGSRRLTAKKFTSELHWSVGRYFFYLLVFSSLFFISFSLLLVKEQSCAVSFLPPQSTVCVPIFGSLKNQLCEELTPGCSPVCPSMLACRTSCIQSFMAVEQRHLTGRAKP